MKKFFFSLIGLLFSTVFLAVFPSRMADAVVAKPGDIPDAQRILAASIRINLYSTDGKYYDQGLGTLVEWEGMKLVITNNHWNFLNKMGKARIYDAQDQLLLELNPRQFKSLVRYRDPGTLILQVPQGLDGAPARLGEAGEVQVGDVVTVARQNPSDPNLISLLQAEILSIDPVDGKTVFQLGLLDGDRIIKGDSGGGIWLNGRLVGNTWAIFVDKEGNFWTRRQNQTAIAAPMPFGILEAGELMPRDKPAADADHILDHAGIYAP